MVTKSMKFTDEEWSIIEKELQKSGMTFSDFARERLTKQQKTENTNLKDFSEILKMNCKALDTQIAKYISVLLEKLEKQEERFNKFLEEKAFAEFTVIATRKDKEKITDINFYKVGDVLENTENVRSVILKIDKEKQSFTLTPYPILEDKYIYIANNVGLKDRVLKKLSRVLRLKKD